MQKASSLVSNSTLDPQLDSVEEAFVTLADPTCQKELACDGIDGKLPRHKGN